MPNYMVRPGKKFGGIKKYGPGDIIEMTEAEAEPLLDIVKRVDAAEIAALSAAEAIGVHVAAPIAVKDKASKGAFSEMSEDLVNKLVEYGFTTEAHVAAATDSEILMIKGIGPSALGEIRSYIPREV